MDHSSAELEAEIVAIARERKRWERTRLRLQQQLTRAHTTAPLAAAHSPPPASVPSPAPDTGSAGTAMGAVQPPHKRRVVLRGGVQEAITKLQSAPADEHKTAAADSPAADTAAPSPPSSTSSVERVRSRRMFAGLLSHLSAASTTLTRDRTTLAQRERLQQQQQQQQPAAQHNTTQQLNDALSRCQQVEAALQKKQVEYRRRAMHSLHRHTEQWKAQWLWTADESDQQPPIAWRVREMTPVWQVVRDEQAKQRLERRRRERLERGEEDEDEVEVKRRRQGWSEDDESELQRLVQLDRDSRQDTLPVLAPDKDSDREARRQQTLPQTSFYRPAARRQQQQPPQSSRRPDSSSGPSGDWQHSEVGSSSGRHRGDDQRDVTAERRRDTRDDRQLGGSKRRWDSMDDDEERDGRRSRVGHRRTVDEFGRDVDEDWSTEVEEETAEEKTAREKAARLREEETDRLLSAD